MYNLESPTTSQGGGAGNGRPSRPGSQSDCQLFKSPIQKCGPQIATEPKRPQDRASKSVAQPTMGRHETTSVNPATQNREVGRLVTLSNVSPQRRPHSDAPLSPLTRYRRACCRTSCSFVRRWPRAFRLRLPGPHPSGHPRAVQGNRTSHSGAGTLHSRAVDVGSNRALTPHSCRQGNRTSFLARECRRNPLTQL
jgi:hypothetical protein